jgi:hypothetical protein
MALAQVDEILALHVDHRMCLAWDVPIRVPRATFQDDPVYTVSEVLRLARLGAIAEELAKSAGDTPIRTVIRDARRRWRIELGIA